MTSRIYYVESKIKLNITLILFREYRKRVRVIDFREAGYLSRAMNDTVARYGGCLARLGVPDTTQQYVLGQNRSADIAISYLDKSEIFLPKNEVFFSPGTPLTTRTAWCRRRCGSARAR